MDDNRNTNILIRPWQPEDFTDINAIALKTWIDTYSSFITLENITTYHQKHYSNAGLKYLFDNRFGLISIVNNQRCGYSTARVHDNQFHLISLYVLPDYQGLGVGCALLEMNLSHARKLNYNTLQVGVMEKNADAYNWYLHNGFTFTKTENFLMGSQTVSVLVGNILLNPTALH